MGDNILRTPSGRNIERYCLLLPKIKSSNEENLTNDCLSQIYSCIDSQWNELANDEGFTTEITRKDIISLQSKHGITKPAWLMKNTAYRVNRASYTLPTLGQVVESESTDSE